jgi:hypothetical protein
MFRWKEIVGGWQANDGADYYDVVQRGDTTFEISSNRTQAAFESLFRLEQDQKKLKEELVRRGSEIEPFWIVGRVSE